MNDINDIKELLENILIEGNLDITKNFKNNIINEIIKYNIPEERIPGAMTRILENPSITKKGYTKNPNSKKIDKIIEEYIEDNKSSTKEQYECLDNFYDDLDKQLYDGHIDNRNEYKTETVQDEIYNTQHNYKHKTKSLKKKSNNNKIN